MTQRQARLELTSRATRRAFRELATGIVLREIDDMWQDEGFGPAEPAEATSGERRLSGPLPSGASAV